MPLLINQKFPRCSLCGKILPLRIEAIAIADQRLCSERCVRLLKKLHPDRLTKSKNQDVQRPQ